MRLLLDRTHFMQLAEQAISRGTMRVLAHLMGIADPRGVVTQPRLEMAETLGVHPQCLTADLTKLVRAGLVRRTCRPAETLALCFNTEVIS